VVCDGRRGLGRKSCHGVEDYRLLSKFSLAEHPQRLVGSLRLGGLLGRESQSTLIRMDAFGIGRGLSLAALAATEMLYTAKAGLKYCTSASRQGLPLVGLLLHQQQRTDKTCLSCLCGVSFCLNKTWGETSEQTKEGIA
jgi:hypothetical protein